MSFVTSDIFYGVIKMELRDKNGLTEKEFLASYKVGDYPRPSVTADNLIFAKNNGGYKLLMIKRGGHPCLGMWALPGGFSNPNETVDTAAGRELMEETGIAGLHLEQLGLFSTPGRDPRAWVMTCAFISVVDFSQVNAKAADDADDVCWFDVSFSDTKLTLSSEKAILTAEIEIEKKETWAGISEKVRVKNSDGIAFDHSEIISEGILRLKKMGLYA